MNFRNLLVILFLCFSCEEETEWPLDNTYTDLIVVDGMLTNEIKEHEIKLTRPVTVLNGTPIPVSGADVTISENDTIYVLKEKPLGSGIYKTDSLMAVVGKTYRLKIIFEGMIYVASAYMIPVNPFSLLQYDTVSGTTNQYKITYVCGIYDPTDPAMYEVIIDWSNLPEYDSIDDKFCRTRLWYYSLSTIDVSQIFPPEKETITFPVGATITEMKYSITPEHEEYIRSLLLETQWHGGYFDAVPANIKTNLSEGAIGFFAVCTVTSLTFSTE
ncbi:MAG: DUF4249 domain-containing protein [Bacteroidia bacterium]|nr:DUF4249 domain-containing protein [Bacteroidia bacterium]